MSKHRTLILWFLLSVCITPALAQQRTPASNIAVPASLPSSVNDKINNADKRLSRQTEKYLNKLARQEEKIFRKLARQDSIIATTFGNPKETYKQLSQKLNHANGKADKLLKGKYLPGLDSLATSLGFLKEAKNIVSGSKNIQQQLSSSLQKLQGLQAKLNEAENVQQLIQQRQQQLKELLSNYSNVKGLSKYAGKYQQQAFYFSQELSQIKESLNQPDKLVAKTLTLLQRLPAFQNFWKRNSMIAAMFPTPDSYGTPQALAGFQTRANVQQALQQQLQLPASSTATGGNPAQMIQQQLQQAQGELSKLKDKLNQLGVSGGGGSDMGMPAQKINPEKTKSIWKRIQLGTTIQSQRATNYFPTTTHIALTAAYKLNDKAMAGIGLSGKIALGQGWKRISLSGEGFGGKVFTEWKAPDLFKTNSKLMASLWFYAGTEINYNRTIESLAAFKNYSNYSKSALAGLSKKYSMNSPFKKGKKVQGSVQVLYDFMSRKNIPDTQAFVWRVGYNF